MNSNLKRLREGIILIEDRRFRSHWGIDPIAIVRALIANLSTRRYAQGGSTITQQLARTLWLSPEKTLFRKLRECIIAWKIEATMSKDHILTAYCANVYMGHRPNGTEIRGMNEASKFYFGRLLKNTSVAQQAWLIGMLKGPNIYKPKTEKGRMRQVWILSVMAHQGLISAEEMDAAVKEL